MPAYDYRCENCGEVFTIRRSISSYSSGAAVACPLCESPRTTRLLGTVAVLSTGKAGGGRTGCGDGAFT